MKLGLKTLVNLLVLIVLPIYSFAESIEINETTSRYARTKIMCRVATEPALKPTLNGWDNLRIANVNFAYADLYGDGSIDLVTGFSDEAYQVDPQYGLREFYKENELRSRQAFQYSFYSPDPEFIVPDGTKFNLARTLVVQDFNSDGIDDIVFVQTGVDYAPYTPWRNEIMLSSPEGYSVSYLPGPRSKYHGGASGDIDNDGDIDLVVSPSSNNSVIAYLNDGHGSFEYTELVRRSARNTAWNVFLWDVDGDGNLDLIASVQAYGADIHWGNGNGRFSTEPSRVALGENRITVQDVEFGDFDGDGISEVVFLSSEGLSAADQTPYSGWSLKIVEFDGREPSEPSVIDEVIARKAGFYWLARFASCDLMENGSLDLVYEHHGEQSPFYAIEQTGTLDNDLTRADKLLWVNDGTGNFSRYRIESQFFFNDDFDPIIEKMAAKFGVTTVRYRAPQTYFPREDGDRFVLYSWRNSQPYPLRKLNDNTVLEEFVYDICNTSEGRILPQNICEKFSVVSTLIRMNEELRIPFDELPELKRYCWDVLKNMELFETLDGDCNDRN